MPEQLLAVVSSAANDTHNSSGLYRYRATGRKKKGTEIAAD